MRTVRGVVFEAVAFARLEGVDWFDTRLLEPNIPLAEAEARNCAKTGRQPCSREMTDLKVCEDGRIGLT